MLSALPRSLDRPGAVGASSTPMNRAARLICLLWIALAARSAHAVVADSPDADAALQSAKTEFEDAQALYTRELYDDAAAKFLSAYERKPFPAFLFNAAVAYEKAKKLDQAVQFFEKYLEKDPEAKDGPEVKSRIEQLKAMLVPPPPPVPAAPGAPPAPAPPPRVMAILPAIATKGLVIIDSKPSGANIYLDDKKGGVFARTPWQGSLEPKTVKVILESKGFKPEERAISPRVDKVYELYIALSEEHFLGWIEVASNVAGAEVFIDRRESGAIGRTPYTGHVKPGKHTLWVQRPGYNISKKEIDVQPGTATTHLVSLERAAVGWLSVLNKESKGGTMLVDGKTVCRTPCQHQVAPGLHKVEVKRDGMEPYQGEVTVDQASETMLNVKFSPQPSRSRAWTTAIISGLFLGGGVYLGLESNKLRDELKRDSKDPVKLTDNNDPRVRRGRYFAIGADVAFGLGALTALTSVISFLSSGPDSTAEVDTRQIGLAPMGSGGMGFAAAGRF